MARRRYSRRSYAPRRSFRRFSRPKNGLNITTAFLGGIAGAFMLPASPQIDMAGVAVATAPIRGLGAVKGIAQGFVFGQAMQHYLLPMLGINIPDLANITGILGGNSATTTNNNTV